MAGNGFLEKVEGCLTHNGFRLIYRSVSGRDRGLFGEELKWEISGHRAEDYFRTYQALDGKIRIVDGPTFPAADVIRGYLYELDEFKKIESADERADRIYDRVRQVMEELKDRINWPKYRSEFPVVLEQFELADEVAKHITAKTEMEVKQFPWFPPEGGVFYAEFDASTMADEEIIDNIGRAIVALEQADHELQIRKYGKILM